MVDRIEEPKEEAYNEWEFPIAYILDVLHRIWFFCEIGQIEFRPRRRFMTSFLENK